MSARVNNFDQCLELFSEHQDLFIKHRLLKVQVDHLFLDEKLTHHVPSRVGEIASHWSQLNTVCIEERVELHDRLVTKHHWHVDI